MTMTTNPLGWIDVRGPASHPKRCRPASAILTIHSLPSGKTRIALCQEDRRHIWLDFDPMTLDYLRSQIGANEKHASLDRASLDRLLEETDPFVCEACGEGYTSIQPCGSCRDEMERQDVPYADADGLLVVDSRDED